MYFANGNKQLYIKHTKKKKNQQNIRIIELYSMVMINLCKRKTILSGNNLVFVP